MQVFVYGTLTDAAQAGRVVDDAEFRNDAVLEGLHRVDGAYPTLAPGGSVEGRILETDDVAALDAYEGVDRGVYVRVPVPVASDAPYGDEAGTYMRTHAGGRTVEVYVGDPDELGVADPVEWASDESDSASFTACVRAVVADCVVRTRD